MQRHKSKKFKQQGKVQPKPQSRVLVPRIKREAQKPKFIEDFEIEKQIAPPGQFGKVFRCRKSDKKILVVKTISKSKFDRLDKSDGQEALSYAMERELDTMRVFKGQTRYSVDNDRNLSR